MKSAKEIVESINYSLDLDFLEEEIPLIEQMLEDWKKEITFELNEFISDIAKLLGEDDLGHDGKSWSIDDFKNAIQEVKEEQDKLTKDACTKAVSKCEEVEVCEFKIHNAIELEDAHRSIMNTKAIKED